MPLSLLAILAVALLFVVAGVPLLMRHQGGSPDERLRPGPGRLEHTTACVAACERRLRRHAATGHRIMRPLRAAPPSTKRLEPTRW